MTQVSNLLNKSFPDAKYTPDRQSTLGSLIGWTFTKSAILSLSACGHQHAAVYDAAV